MLAATKGSNLREAMYLGWSHYSLGKSAEKAFWSHEVPPLLLHSVQALPVHNLCLRRVEIGALPTSIVPTLLTNVLCLFSVRGLLQPLT